MSEKHTAQIELSKKGFPCMWEQGGGASNTGEATIIASPDGNPKSAIYIRRKGQLANSRHALIPIAKGDVVVRVSHHRQDFTILIYVVDGIDTDSLHAELVKIYEFSNGEWDTDPPTYLDAAILAAKHKSLDYHCRKPYFINNTQ